MHVDDLVRAGDVWVRLARNWWTNEQLLEVVDGSDPDAVEPLGVIDIGANDDGCEWSWIAGVYAHEDHVFVVQSVASESFDGNIYEYEEFSRVIAVDISDPTAPVIAECSAADRSRRRRRVWR